MSFANTRTRFSLDIDPARLDRTGVIREGDDPESRLSGSVEILGTWHHLDLIEVDGNLQAVNQDLEHQLEALDELNGEGLPEHVEINGRFYVRVITPFCR